MFCMVLFKNNKNRFGFYEIGVGQIESRNEQSEWRCDEMVIYE